MRNKRKNKFAKGDAVDTGDFVAYDSNRSRCDLVTFNIEWRRKGPMMFNS